jgi:hypothetical protein
MSKNNLPEKVYIRENSPKIGSMIEGDDLSYSCYSKPHTKHYIEYIRADIAEQMAKEFAKIFYAEEISGIDVLRKMIPPENHRIILNVCSKSETITLSEINSSTIVEAINLLIRSTK